MFGLQKLIMRVLAVLLSVALVGGLGAIAAKQYAAKAVAQAAQESVKEAVREAVADRKEAVKVDVAQTAARAVASRKMASTVISHREKSQEVISHYEKQYKTNADCAERDAARLGVLISAAREINRVIDSIDSTPSLP
jgi:predicted solute-binding protein